MKTYQLRSIFDPLLLFGICLFASKGVCSVFVDPSRDNNRSLWYRNGIIIIT